MSKNEVILRVTRNIVDRSYGSFLRWHISTGEEAHPQSPCNRELYHRGDWPKPKHVQLLDVTEESGCAFINRALGHLILRSEILEDYIKGKARYVSCLAPIGGESKR